jgi:hypothetical protein
MRTLVGIALFIIGATSADAAVPLISASLEKPVVIAAAQRSASDLAYIKVTAMQAPASCQLLPHTDALNECSVEDATVLASAPPRRPRTKTRRR